MSWGEEIPYWLEIAQAEIGKGETMANNKGPDIKRYAQGKDGQPWCASFVAYCLKEAECIGRFRYPKVARDFWNNYGKWRLAHEIDSPEPGDIIIFWRGKFKGWQGHCGIVDFVYLNTAGDWKISVIEGNKGPFPAKVARFEYGLDNIPKLLGFVRPKK